MNTQKFENEFVTQVYDEIAPHFSHTRYKPWPFVEEFLTNCPDNSIVADVGCGNGKYMDINKKLKMIGSDISSSLINICKARELEVLVADGLHLPYRSNTFDASISIAVIHHFSTAERRIQAIKELVRIIKPNGFALIEVWAFEQVDSKGKQKYTEQDVFVPWHLQKHFTLHKDQQQQQTSEENTIKEETEQNETIENENPLLVQAPQVKPVEKDSQTGQMVYKRYYHMFKKGELEEIALALNAQKEVNGFSIEIVKQHFEKDNWCVILQKKV